MTARRWGVGAATVAALVMVLGACGSSSPGTSAGPGSTTATTRAVGPPLPTTPAGMSEAASQAAHQLADQTGFTLDESSCIVTALVAGIGEEAGLAVLQTPSESVPAEQRPVMEKALSGCVAPDALATLVARGAPFGDAGTTITAAQRSCLGARMLEVIGLRTLLFDQEAALVATADATKLAALAAPCLDAGADAFVRSASTYAADTVAEVAVRTVLTAATARAQAAKTYRGLTRDALAADDEARTFGADGAPSDGPTAVSWHLGGAKGTTLYLAVRSTSGTCFLLRDDLDDTTVASRQFGKLASGACSASALPDASFADAW